ncbi:MAG: YbjP/YqhG family protein [Methylacidiphilales bacterium]|nr:YbjP/YqhG family protein [Candidatus Methylacidiphilales bacterium]
MQLSRLGLVALLLGLLSMLHLPAATDADSPADVVRALFHSAQLHFGFSPESVKAAKPWVTPKLYARMWKKVNEPVPKGDAPDIEGDLFLNSQDPPDKFEIGDTPIDHATAQVAVTLVWPSEKRKETVLLEQIDGVWKVNDVDYGKDGKLSDLLH